METKAPPTFEGQLISLLPSMRAWALALTRNPAAADDLVQDVAVKALVGKASFMEGTNFKGWMHRIMINHFIAGARSRREFVSIAEMPEVPIPAEQPGKIDMQQLSSEFDRLPAYLRDALRQIALEDRSYEDLALVSGCAIGTLKSRVHRARVTLRTRMDQPQRSAA